MTININAKTRDRTGDLQIFGLTLSQLSYRGLSFRPRAQCEGGVRFLKEKGKAAFLFFGKLVWGERVRFVGVFFRWVIQ